MKVAIYPGSFNPLHRGHIDVIEKALKVFDKVILAKGVNPDKTVGVRYLKHNSEMFAEYVTKNMPYEIQGKVDGFTFQSLLKDFIDTIKQPDAIIKGLRNGRDLEYEKDQQYWNEDLGVEIPFFYIISDRNNCHISSRAIRGLEKFGMDI